MVETTNISIGRQYNLDVGWRSVVQKGNVGKKYIYALQLRNDATEAYVLRGNPGSSIRTEILHLTGSAGGHTQTWEYSGKKNKWFIGVKPSASSPWDKQIARVDIKTMSGTHSTNTDFPRIAYLNLAGRPDRPGKPGDRCTGANMSRVEAAVSPDYNWFLIANVEINGTGHFAIYDMEAINSALDQAGPNGFINLGDYKCKESFTIEKFVSLWDKNGKIKQKGIIDSIQGYDIDNKLNIYISSQKSPEFNKTTGKFTAHHKEIVKIPHKTQTEPSSWGHVNLSSWKGIDLSGKHSEVEGIQILDPDHAYVTVAYHAKVGKSNKTVLNMIYELSWTWPQ